MDRVQYGATIVIGVVYYALIAGLLVLAVTGATR